MAKLITASIDVTKIDKSRIIEGRKGGKYLSLTLWVNEEDDQFGNNVSIEQSQTKEERDANSPKNYLGNGKEWRGNGGGVKKPAPATVIDDDDDIPF